MLLTCPACGDGPDDEDPMVGFDDFRDGAAYHLSCMSRVLHEALVQAEAELAVWRKRALGVADVTA